VPDPAWLLTVAYAAGVVVGLLRTDAPPGARAALALLWPIGPLAFAVTVTVLLGAAVVAFPWIGAVAAAAAIAYSVLSM
jgi:hypothetical protein